LSERALEKAKGVQSKIEQLEIELEFLRNQNDYLYETLYKEREARKNLKKAEEARRYYTTLFVLACAGIAVVSLIAFFFYYNSSSTTLKSIQTNMSDFMDQNEASLTRNRDLANNLLEYNAANKSLVKDVMEFNQVRQPQWDNIVGCCTPIPESDLATIPLIKVAQMHSLVMSGNTYNEKLIQVGQNLDMMDLHLATWFLS
jgi:DNA repair exonuclease SbcCD ATPase subunit